MKVIENIYKAIKVNSNFIIEEGDQWTRELAGAKNYIATPDLKHWTFGKSVGADGEYHYNGGIAKKHLYNLGFINVLDIKDKKSKELILNAFIEWAKKVDTYPILEKFKRDQKTNKRFELLIHQSLLNRESKYQPKRTSNQQSFDEGFKNEIIREVTYRNRKIVNLAKEKHGTKCEVCQFDFAVTYGSHGDGFIEMHHLFPMHNGRRKTTTEDLRPVCANCHRMLHRGKEMLSIEELMEIIKENLEA
jgi:predicted HNH restriction endonuclease